MTNSFDRFTELTPRLQRKAAVLAHVNNEHAADDLFQEMAISYITRTARDSEFTHQKDAYIANELTWDAQNVAEKGRVYNRYMDSETMLADDEGDPISSFEFISCEGPTPEETCIETETIEALSEAILSLTPENQQIVKMIYLGYTQVEIAEKMGISKPAVTQRKATIAKTLSQIISL